MNNKMFVKLNNRSIQIEENNTPEDESIKKELKREKLRLGVRVKNIYYQFTILKRLLES